MAIMIRLHESYRKIIAACDSDLIGKKFVEGKLQLDLRDTFYGGKEYSEEKAIEIFRDGAFDDATFNIVGKECIAAAIKAGMVEKEGVITIQGIPHALSFM
ncbi:MAG: DUF424 family protein [Nanoarchaeota archaeon]|nr:DUF424 family protein [Nanoarchaeota archaeon]